MTTKIRIPFKNTPAAKAFCDKLKASRPSGYNSTTIARHGNRPDVYVYGTFNEAQEAAIMAMK